jgi:hypothetical protein
MPLNTDDEMGDDDTGDDNGGGVFGQPGDVFGNPAPSPVNPQITRAQEQQPQNMPGTPAPEPRRDLVFAQDALGRTTVAWAVNGNLVEAFRQPTAEELKLAPQARWRAVPPPAQPQSSIPGVAAQQPAMMGMVPMGQVPPGGVQPAPQPAANGGPGFGSLLIKLIAAAAVAYGSWRAYEWYKEHEDDATDEELAEADDVDEEVVA